jgi:hypothetical protein
MLDVKARGGAGTQRECDGWCCTAILNIQVYRGSRPSLDSEVMRADPPASASSMTQLSIWSLKPPSQLLSRCPDS